MYGTLTMDRMDPDWEVGFKVSCKPRDAGESGCWGGGVARVWLYLCCSKNMDILATIVTS